MTKIDAKMTPQKVTFSDPHWSKSTAYLWGMSFPKGHLSGSILGSKSGGAFVENCKISKNL
jgi:hypothetical protein